MDKNEFFTNRYVRLGLLVVLGAVLTYLIVRMLIYFLGLDQAQFPNELLIPISLLVAGYLVYRFFARSFNY